MTYNMKEAHYDDLSQSSQNPEGVRAHGEMFDPITYIKLLASLNGRF